MISPFLIEQQVFANRYPGLQRMISVALADEAFAEALITDPVTALDLAPAGIVLSAQEYQIVISVPSSMHLAEFAARLCMLAYIQWTDQNAPWF